MADNDSKILEDAGAAVTRIDVQYRRANIREKREMRDERDAAFNAYAAARRKLLEDEVIATDQDVDEMRDLRAEIESAADTQALIVAAGKVAGFLMRRFV